jgi:hypothetical protein
MAIDASKVQWDAPAIDTSAVQWDAPPAPQQSSGIPTARQAPGFMTQLGRGAASLADVTLGGLIPAAIQQVGYPIARIGRSEEEAKAATQRLISTVDQPFGKAFGVTATPEYQQESGRKLLDFVGQNFQKGSKWISEKTGLPQADVESILGSATVAAPKVVPPVAQAIQRGAAPAIEKAVVGAKMPFEKQIQARRERMSAEDYARGPQIDALAEAQRLKFAMNPADVQAGAGPKLTSMVAGEKGVEAITSVNKNRVREVALNDMGLPPTSQLDGGAAFKQARAQVEKPYRDVAKLPIQQADDAMIQRLEAIRSDMDVIGAKEYAPAISKIVDDAISKTQTGLTGEKLLKNISVLRERARKTYNNKSATTEALDVADTNLKVATELESMIDNSIFNPKLLSEYRDARQKMARTYAYEGATDFNTGMVDVGKLARITSGNSALTGDIASLGKIAGNFPEMFTTRAAAPWAKAAALGRTGFAGTLGGLVGYAIGDGYTGAAIGSVLGAGAGKYGQSVAAQRIASPGYQAGLQLRDARIPVNQLAASVQPIPQDRAVVPYQPEVLGPSDAGNANKLRIVSYDENGVPIYMADERGQGFTMQPNPSFGAAPSPYAQRALPNEIPQQIYRAQKNAELAQEFRAAAERKPAGRGTPLVFDSAGNLVEAPPAGTGGVVGAPTSLESAVKKLSGIVVPETQTTYKTQTISPKTGTKPYTRITKKEGETTFERGVSQAFDLTSEERIAWNKSKADLAVASPELKGLTDKAIAAKMMDRQWIADTIQKVKDKALANEQIAARASTAKTIREAAIKREQLNETVEMLEEQYRKARPVKKEGPGPRSKTRAFQRNMLTPEQEIQNALVK